MTVVEAPARNDVSWIVLRLVLAVLFLLVVGYAAAAHRTSAPLQGLYADVSRGAVSQVTLTGGFPYGTSGGTAPEEARGHAVQTATWTTGTRHWVAEYVVERPAGQADVGWRDLERTTDDVAAEILRRDPDVRVVARDYTSGWSGQVYGTRLPVLLGVPMLVGLLAGLVLLISGPQPWRATRWGWFWLSHVPGGALAFLVLSGPTPGVPPPRDVHHRLTGGWAFLLALPLGALVTAAVAAALQAVWTPHPVTRS